jgi:predicted transcriptional regulator
MKNISLGPLEQEVMNCVWSKKQCCVREIVECLGNDRKIAYNTIQTIMSRLVDKGLLRRNLEGKTHIYEPVIKRKNALSAIISQAMGGITHQFGEEALVAFVDGLEDISDETRKEMIRKLQKK